MKQHLHVLLRKCVLSCIAVSAFTHSSFSQIGIFNQVEAGITVGPSNFLGDLGGTRGRGMTFLKDNNLSQTKLTVGAYVSAMTLPYLGFRLAANYGSLSGDDKIINGKGGLEEARKFRNSDFKSVLTEAFLVTEVYPTVLFEEDYEDIYHKLRPYGLVGVGVFHFNPKGSDPETGKWVNLKELSTEGQGFAEHPDRKPYALTQLNIPIGAGIKYFITENTSIAFEVIHRKTFTDYIDDVSTNYIDPNLFDKYFGAGTEKTMLARRMANKTDQGTSTNAGFGPGNKRGTPTNNDAYYTFGFKLGFRLGNKNNDYDSKRMGCPIMRF